MGPSTSDPIRIPVVDSYAQHFARVRMRVSSDCPAREPVVRDGRPLRAPPDGRRTLASGPLLLISDNIGQLGNQIARLAHFVAFAEQHGVQIGHAHFRRYASYFPAFADDPLCRYPAARRVHQRRATALAAAARVVGARAPTAENAYLSILRHGGPNEYDMGAPEFVALASRARLLLVHGFMFRDEQSFREHAALVREVFTPQPVHLDAARRAAEHARGGADLLMGVHIRRGDYADWNAGRYYWTDDQYASLMTRAAQHWPNRRVGFLICSNDTWDSAAFPDSVTAGPGHEVEDMYALAHCDAIVGPPSTFTLWASFWGHAPLWSAGSPDDEPQFQVALIDA